MLKRKHAIDEIFELKTRNLLTQDVEVKIPNLLVEVDVSNFVGDSVPVEIRIGTKRFFGSGIITSASDISLKTVKQFVEKKVQSDVKSEERNSDNDKN